MRTQPTPRQRAVLAAYVESGGSAVRVAAKLGIRPSTVKRHLADLRARFGLSTEQLIYLGRADGWLDVPTLETGCAGSFRLTRHPDAMTRL